jgi:hypothetical protein
LRSALPLVCTAGPEDAGHRKVFLHFLTAFAHTADLAGADPETLSVALRHVSNQGAFTVAEQMQFLDVHRTILNRALAAGLRDTAVAVASAAAVCDALNEADRAMPLALLLKTGSVDQRTVELLDRFVATPSRQTLLRALEQSLSGIDSALLGDAEAVRSAAEWALSFDPQAKWPGGRWRLRLTGSASSTGLLTRSRFWWMTPKQDSRGLGLYSGRASLRTPGRVCVASRRPPRCPESSGS